MYAVFGTKQQHASAQTERVSSMGNLSVGGDPSVSAWGTREDAAGTLSAIRQAFSQTKVSVAWLSQEQQIQQYAASAGLGNHLVIAPDFVEWMASGEEAFRQGMTFLSVAMAGQEKNTGSFYNSGTVIGENGEISYWSSTREQENNTAFEMMNRILEEQKEENKRLTQERQKKTAVKKKIGYSQGRDMSRLARSYTVKDVRSLISKVYAQKISVKGNGSYDKEEVYMTTAQMDRVIACARSKIRALEEESVMERKQKKAEQQQQMKRALQIQLALKKRRAARYNREYRQIFEELPYLARQLLKAYHESLQPQDLSGQIAGMAGIAAGVPAVGAGSAAGSIISPPAASVSVSVSGAASLNVVI